MKKNVFYLFAHQDDEFGIFIDIFKKIKTNNIYIFYLTSGYQNKISKTVLSERDMESIKVLKKIGVKQKILYLSVEKMILVVINYTLMQIRPIKK